MSGLSTSLNLGGLTSSLNLAETPSVSFLGQTRFSVGRTFDVVVPVTSSNPRPCFERSGDGLRVLVDGTYSIGTNFSFGFNANASLTLNVFSGPITQSAFGSFVGYLFDIKRGSRTILNESIGNSNTGTLHGNIAGLLTVNPGSRGSTRRIEVDLLAGDIITISSRRTLFGNVTYSRSITTAPRFNISATYQLGSASVSLQNLTENTYNMSLNRIRSGTTTNLGLIDLIEATEKSSSKGAVDAPDNFMAGDIIRASVSGTKSFRLNTSNIKIEVEDHG